MLVYLVIYDSKAICFSPDGKFMGIGMSASSAIFGSDEYVPPFLDLLLLIYYSRA